MNPRLLLCTLAFAASLAACGGGGSDTGTNNSTSNSPPAPSQTGTSNIEIAWTPPVEKTDGSVLTDLAGYRFYIGTQPGDYSESVSVDSPGLSRYVIDNLPPNTYYVAMTAYRTNGLESALSNEVVKTAN